MSKASEAHVDENAVTARQMRTTAIAMREDHGPDHERHEMWSTMADLIFMAADHLDGLGNTCRSCVSQAQAVTAAYDAAKAPKPTSKPA